MKLKNQIQKFQNFVIFKTDERRVNIGVFFHSDTLWSTQKKISELFDVDVRTISEHLQICFEKVN